MAHCDSYYYGECTFGCCQSAAWVQDGWGNAGDWASNAAASGFQLTNIPTQGAVVIYAPGDGYSRFGHCALVTDVGVGDQFLVHEMNFAAWNEYDDRWSSSYDVLAFILPPGVSPGFGGPALGRGGPGEPSNLAVELGGLASDWNQTMPDQFAVLTQIRREAEAL